MNWVALLQSILQVAVYISKYVSDQQLIKAGEAQMIRKQLGVLGEKIKAADIARANSIDDSNSGGLLEDDGYRRN